jgi:hypothetical protein
MLDLKLKATDNEARVFAGCQLVLALAVAWWLNKSGYDTAGIAVIAVSVAVAVIGLIKPRATAPLYAAWMLAAFPIGWVMSYVMASIVYFLVVTPIGLLARLFGHDGMGRKFKPEAESYWTETQPSDPKRYFRQF